MSSEDMKKKALDAIAADMVAERNAVLAQTKAERRSFKQKAECYEIPLKEKITLAMLTKQCAKVIELIVNFITRWCDYGTEGRATVEKADWRATQVIDDGSVSQFRRVFNALNDLLTERGVRPCIEGNSLLWHHYDGWYINTAEDRVEIIKEIVLFSARCRVKGITPAPRLLEYENDNLWGTFIQELLFQETPWEIKREIRDINGILTEGAIENGTIITGKSNISVRSVITDIGIDVIVESSKMQLLNGTTIEGGKNSGRIWIKSFTEGTVDGIQYNREWFLRYWRDVRNGRLEE